MFKKQLDEGLAGDNAGSCCVGIAKEDVSGAGWWLAKGGSITPHYEVQGGQSDILTKGRRADTHHNRSSRDIVRILLRTTDVTRDCGVALGTEMVMRKTT